MGPSILLYFAIFPFPVIEGVINGIPSKSGQFPYMVALMIKDYNLLNCGGVIVSSRLVLSTAHCVCDQWSYKYYYALVGTHDLTGEGLRYELDKSICDENYVAETLTNDIGFVRTAVPFMFNPFVKFIALHVSRIPAREYIIATGWGSLVHHGDFFPDVLRYDFLELIDSDQCRSVFKTFTNQNILCSKANNYKGMCEGDSGSPVMYNGALAGIYFATSEGTADLFVEVAAIVPWIMRTILINNRDETGKIFIDTNPAHNYTHYYWNNGKNNESEVSNYAVD